MRKITEVVTFLNKNNLGHYTDGWSMPPSAIDVAKTVDAVRENEPPVTAELVNLLVTKPMQLANYFCTGDVDPPDWVRAFFSRLFFLKSSYFAPTHEKGNLPA